MNLVASDNCSWCHFPSPYGRLCRRCGHQARVPQIYCECSVCVIHPAVKMGLIGTGDV